MSGGVGEELLNVFLCVPPLTCIKALWIWNVWSINSLCPCEIRNIPFIYAVPKVHSGWVGKVFWTFHLFWIYISHCLCSELEREICLLANTTFTPTFFLLFLCLVFMFVNYYDWFILRGLCLEAFGPTVLELLLGARRKGVKSLTSLPRCNLI